MANFKYSLALGGGMRDSLAKTYKLLSLPLFLAAFLLFSSLANSSPAPETWGDFINEPDISYGQLRTAREHLENSRTISDIFSGECVEASFPIAEDQEMTECWYETQAGRSTKGGQGYVPVGADKAGFMKDFATMNFPLSNTDVLLETTADFGDSWLRKGDALEATMVGGRPNFWTWDNPASLHLGPLDEDYLYAQAAFSNNDRWLLFFDTTGYLVRIDLQNLTVSTYRVPIKDQNDYYWAATAISDSGRYIAAYEYGYDFLVIDTEGCTELKDHIEIPSSEVTCTTRSIMDYAREYYDDLASLYPEFYGDDVLRIRGINPDGEGDEIVLRAPNTRAGTNYIALGDSYTSGEGAYNYLSGTDDPNNRCHISDRSYPFLLGRWLNLDSTHSVACSGAKMHNIALGHPNDAPQNSKLPSNRSLGKWLPGYKWQIEHIKDPSNPVDIVTVGISGNDIGFGDKLSQCLLKTGTCFGTTYERVGIALEINEQFERLSTLYGSIRSQALKKSPSVKVYAIGYPQIFDVSGSYEGKCGFNVRLNYEEVSLAASLITYLNNMVRLAAEKAGVRYVSIEGALGSNKLCGASNPKAVNGVTAGDGALPYYLGPFAVESFHPTRHGHSQIAEAIRKGTSEFNLSLPPPLKLMNAPNPLRNTLVGNSPDLPGTIRRFVFGGDITPDYIIKGSDYYLFIGGKYGLSVGTKATVTFHSEPTLIGEYEVGQNGTLGINYSVPDSLNPGLHTMHVYGETASGEKVDVYKSVYVALSEDDWDGDGTPNNQEICGIFEPAGVDQDSDGVDDGCDGVVEDNFVQSHRVGLVGSSVQPQIQHKTNNEMGGSKMTGLISIKDHVGISTNSIQEGPSSFESKNTSVREALLLVMFVFLLLVIFYFIKTLINI